MRPANPQPTPEPASAGVVHPANKLLFDKTRHKGLLQVVRCQARGFVHLLENARAYESSMIGLSALTVSMVSASAADLSGR